MPKRMRRKFLIDFKVQGTLALRAAVYWAFCLFTLAVMLIIWSVFRSPPQPFHMHLDDLWHRFAPALLASGLLLPLVLMDVIRFSNRFAGPVFRLRRSMKALSLGEAVAPIRFRDDDFWHEIADDFNIVATRMRALQSDDLAQPVDEPGEPVTV